MRSYIISELSGSGKTTAREHAERRGYLAASVGDVVRRRYKAADPGVSVDEFVLQVHAAEGRAAFARAAVAQLKRDWPTTSDPQRASLLRGSTRRRRSGCWTGFSGSSTAGWRR